MKIFKIEVFLESGLIKVIHQRANHLQGGNQADLPE